MHFSTMRIRELFVVALLLLVGGQAVALSVVSSTLQVKDIRVDELNYMKMAIYTVEFDQDLFVGETPIGDFQEKDTDPQGIPHCWTPSFCICTPSVMSRLLGSAMLENGERTYFSNSNTTCKGDDNQYPIAHLIPLPPSLDSYRSFLTLTYLLESEIEANNRTLSYALFLDLRMGGYQSYEFNTTSINELKSYRLNIHLKHFGLNEENVTVTSWKDWAPSPCNFRMTQKLQYEFDLYTGLLGSQSIWTDLELHRWNIPMLEQTSDYQSCWQEIREQLQILQYQSNEQSIRCPYEYLSPDWKEDPCCNLWISWEFCCASRTLLTQKELLGGLDADAAETCQNREKSLQVLSDLVASYDSAVDEQTGCTAQRKKVIDTEGFEKSMSFLRECDTILFGSIYRNPCNSDDDCYTKCLNGMCELPLDDWNNIVFQCFYDKIPTDSKSYLEAYWGLPVGSSEQVFKNRFMEEFVEIGCEGPTSLSLTGSGQDYYPADEESCLNLKGCNWDPELSEAECLNPASPEFCAYCNGRSCTDLTVPKGCYKKTNSESYCDEIGGDFTSRTLEYPCSLGQYQNRDECIPEDICPRSKAGQIAEIHCEKQFCYTKNITEVECRLNGKLRWDSDLANGKGLCVLFGATESTCEDMLIKNKLIDFEWWYGRTWTDGWLNTQESCDAGACLEQNSFSFGLNSTQCKDLEFCSGYCPICTSPYGYTACIGYGLGLDGCELLGGSIIEDSGNCLFPFTEDECYTKGFEYQNCENYSSTVCYDCITKGKCPFEQSVLQCAVNYKNPCNKDNCQKGGYCHDKELYDENTQLDCPSYANVDLMTEDNYLCFGSCVLSYIIDGSGRAYCYYPEIPGKSGCISHDINPRYCRRMQGTFFYIGRDYESCELFERTIGGNRTALKGCLDNADGILSDKDEDDCESCGGVMMSYYKWDEGIWTKGGRSVATSWAIRNYGPMNEFKPTINLGKMFEVVEKALVKKFSTSFQIESNCLYQPLTQAITTYACDCTNSPGTPNCFSGEARTVTIGSQVFCYGISDWILSGFFEIRTSKTSVAFQDACVEVLMSNVPASNYRRSSTGSVSSDQLTGTTGQKITNPYAVIENSKYIIGQLIGDGLQFNFEKSLHEVYICIDKRPDISIESFFQTPKFTFKDSETGYWVLLDIPVNVTESGLCGTISIPTISGDKDSRSIFPAYVDLAGLSEESMAFVITLCVFDTILAAISIFLSLYHTWKSKNWYEVTVLKAMFVSFSIFLTMRATYLGLTAEGLIEDGSLEQLLLYDFPLTLYFMAYTCLIFFWAEISSDMTVAQTRFISRLRWPFLASNSIVFFAFILVAVIDTHGSADLTKDLRTAYYYILASISFSIFASIVFFGRKLTHLLFAYQENGINENQKSISNRIRSVAIICGMGFLFTSGWLVMNIYVNVKDLNVACIQILVGEIIPCGIIIFILGIRPLESRRPKPVDNRRLIINA
eukprot:TRINITY_DN956_c0_g1_i4.p1 TRINITY_DN956_c0_g1~~TRINITY_DN956_c0_g1_i4.p1  ORF type:complete len:1467 (+),score=267.82 TRINITY_DN956_c0_g1_i4:43-4443(+)